LSTAYLRSRIEERANLSDTATAIYDKAAADNRDVTADEQVLLDGWESRSKILDGEIAKLETAAKANQRVQSSIGRLDDLEEGEGRNAFRKREANQKPVEIRTAGQRFVESDEFKEYRGRGTMGAVELPNFLGLDRHLEQRAAEDPITTATLSLDRYHWDGPTGPTLVTPLLSVIGREPVTSGAVDYTVWGPAPEAGGPIAEGAVKPAADLVPTPASGTLGTYAHWKPISRQALEDSPRVQSIVEGKLRQGLALKLQSEALAAIIAPLVPWPTVSAVGASAAIRQAIAVLQGSGYAPNAVLLNADDYANADIAAADASNSGPTSYGNFWGLVPVPVPGLAAGTAYVGDFKEAVTWFDRNTTSVYHTDSHADYFIKNLLVILAEQRALFAVTDPNAGVEVTIEAAAPPVDEGGVSRSRSSK
jgi:hypothetical protein